MKKHSTPFLNEDFKERILDLSASAIYVYDLDLGINIYLNKQYTNLTGYTLETINKMSQAEFFALFHPDDQKKIAEHMEEVVNLNLGEVSEIEYQFKCADGRWMWCLSRDAIFAVDPNGRNTQFMGTFVDITARKHAELAVNNINNRLEFLVKERTVQLEKSLSTQKLLLQEVHHRVKNNLQLLISLFNLSASKEKSTSTKKAIDECKEKIHSLALVYNNLHESKDLSEIDFSEYLKNLCSHLERSMKGDKCIKIALNLKSAMISIDNAITFGLITNELITNCYKHAFPTNKEGTISIHLNSKGEMMTLTITDDGIGMPTNFELNKTQNFGLGMVQTLVEQVNGHLEIENNNGVRHTLSFEI